MFPVLIVLSLGVFRIRAAWKWSWAAWLNDIDFLGWPLHLAFGIPNVHRALFHNVWLLLGLLALSWNGWTKWRREGHVRLTEFAQKHPGFFLVPFYYFTHLVFDVFAGGITAFWPLSQTTYFWNFEIDVDTTRPIPTPIFVSDPGTVAGTPDVSQIYLWMTDEQFAFFLVYLVALGLWYLYDRRRRRDKDERPLHGSN